MEKKTLTPYIVVVALMLATSLALAFTVDVSITDEAGVTLELPDEIGDWTGLEIRFCLNARCQRAATVDQLEDIDVCNECEGKMSTMSFIEAQQLPADTMMIKKRYEDRLGRQLMVAIVLSGRERASIHRPEVCLVGQGRELVESRVFSVPVEDRGSPLDVMMLELHRPARAGGPFGEENMYYAYWFAGKNRETPHHVMRMIYMASDRIFHNVAHRWAYISVSGMRRPNSNEHEVLVSEFIRELYPHLMLKPGA